MRNRVVQDPIIFLRLNSHPCCQYAISRRTFPNAEDDRFSDDMESSLDQARTWVQIMVLMQIEQGIGYKRAVVNCHYRRSAFWIHTKRTSPFLLTAL